MNKVKMPKFLIIATLILFAFLVWRLSTISLSKYVDGIDIKELSSSRTTKKISIPSNRGTIYDSKGNILVQDVTTYILIAYLDSNRTTNPDKPQHVVDKENTAIILAELLNGDKEYILSCLNKENVYQTEFGTLGKNLSEIEKNKIQEANLPGIDFIESSKRYYPYGDFASYLIGYAKTDEEGNTTGELGIEKKYNEELTGSDGYKIYTKDKSGYKIPNTQEIVEEGEDGNSIYLTIDANVQFFLEQAVKENANAGFSSMSIIIEEAETGKIIATTTTPSFDPNIRNITNYLDQMEVAFEPGSTMKIFTYMATIESGNYAGTDTFLSGSYTTKDGTVIGDYNEKVGWGWISYDEGFKHSSNVGVTHLFSKNFLNPLYFKNYLLKLGFGRKTGLGTSLEAKGKLDFKYETEIYNAGFGQGITTTPLQYMKALTAIANDGILLEPYIIDKIEDSKGNTIYQGKRKELGRIAKKSTTDKMKDLMESVITEYDATGTQYYMEGYDIIGKTGTAQIADSSGYGDDYNNVNTSVVLMYPKDDPKIIIYGVTKNFQYTYPLSNTLKTVIKDISKYYNIYGEQKTEEEKKEIYTISSFKNKNVDEVKKQLTDLGINPIIIGDGNKVVKQYPKSGRVSNLDKVFLITNSEESQIPAMYGYSKNEIKKLAELLNFKVNFEGSGYCVSQSINPGTKIENDTVITVNLDTIY